jgi:hypothetical protein
VGVGHRREDARDRDRLRAPGDLGREPGDAVCVERRQLAAVELDASTDDAFAGRHHGDEVVRPSEQRPDGARGRRAETQDRDASEASALEHGVRRMRRAEHRVRDPAGIEFLDHSRDRRLDAGRDV